MMLPPAEDNRNKIASSSSLTAVPVEGRVGNKLRGLTQNGRDHWSHCFPCLFAGAGTQGGALYGQSDEHAAYPANDPVSPADLAATIYQSLGIAPDLRIPNPIGQPVPLVENGHPVSAIFG